MIFASYYDRVQTQQRNRQKRHFVKRSNSRMFMCGPNKSFMAMKFLWTVSNNTE